MAIIKEISLDMARPQQFVQLTLQQGEAILRQIDVQILNNNEVYTIPTDAICSIRAINSQGIRIDDECTLVNNKVRFTITPTMTALAERLPCQIKLVLPSSGGIAKTVRFHMLINPSINVDEFIVITDEYTQLDNALLKVNDWDNLFEEAYPNLDSIYATRLNTIDSQLAQKASLETANSLQNQISTITTQSDSYYVKCLQTDTGALLVVSTGATTGQINITDVKHMSDYTPVAGDYVTKIYNTVNAETKDIRIGANAKVYGSAGEAVRGQIGELKQDLSDLYEILPPTFKLENKYITNSYTGDSLNHDILCFGVSAGERIILDGNWATTIPAGVFFDIDGRVISQFPTNFVEGIYNIELTVPNNACVVYVNSNKTVRNTTLKVARNKKYITKNKYYDIKKGYVVNNDLTYQAISGHSTIIVDVYKDEKYRIKGSRNAYMPFVIFEKNDSSFVTPFFIYNQVIDNYGYLSIDITIPDGVKKILLPTIDKSSSTVNIKEVYKIFDDYEYYKEYKDNSNFTFVSEAVNPNYIMNYVPEYQYVSNNGYASRKFMCKAGQKFIIKGSYTMYTPLFVLLDTQGRISKMKFFGTADEANYESCVQITSDGDNYELYVNTIAGNLEVYVEKGEYGDNIIVDKNGNGNFTKFKDATEYCWYHPNVTVNVHGGDYDLVEEYGNDYLNSISGGYKYKHEIGAECGYGTKYIFNSNARLLFNYQGSNAYVAELFSPINIVGSCEFNTMPIICSNCRYCVHEDTPTVLHLQPYNMRVKYKDCHLVHNSNTIGTYRTTACIGAGCSPYSVSTIDGGVYSCPDSYAISYHHPSMDGSKPATVVIKGAWCDGKVQTSLFPDNSSANIIFNVSNCSLSEDVIIADKTDAKIWNNQVRV